MLKTQYMYFEVCAAGFSH